MQTGDRPHTEKRDTLLFYFKYVSAGRYLLVNVMTSIVNDDGKVHSQIMKLLITLQTIVFAAALLTVAHSHGRHPAGLRGRMKEESSHYLSASLLMCSL